MRTGRHPKAHSIYRVGAHKHWSTLDEGDRFHPNSHISMQPLKSGRSSSSRATGKCRRSRSFLTQAFPRAWKTPARLTCCPQQCPSSRRCAPYAPEWRSPRLPTFQPCILMLPTYCHQQKKCWPRGDTPPQGQQHQNIIFL